MSLPLEVSAPVEASQMLLQTMVIEVLLPRMEAGIGPSKVAADSYRRQPTSLGMKEKGCRSFEAVAEIVILRHFNTRRVPPEALASLAELCSMRFVNGVSARIGLMGIDYATAAWLYKDLGYTAYRVSSVDDLYNPFVSMYFGAAYVAWLSEFEGRERSHQFIVQAYLGGPHNVNLQETGPLWNKFQEILSNYQDPKKEQGNCCIL